MIQVLINDTVKKYLIKQPAAVRKKIRTKFEFLESGMWDGGLRVKKLKGLSSKFVFEARMDKANRILFTLGHTPDDNQTLLIYVWGISVHDDVSRKSKTIIPHNVPFLQFSDYEEKEMDNLDMEELDGEYFTQESITEKVNDESGSQRWYRLDEPEWERIQMYRRDDLELFLYLTGEQKEILKTPLPLMISGTAGSGKTTLAVYYLLNERLNKKKKLFITYNKLLKNYAKNLYNGLLQQREWKDRAAAPEFYTFRELCLEIAGDNRFPPENEVDFNRFKQMLTTCPLRVSLDAALLWEEIRGIIKGAMPRINLQVLKKALRELKKGSIPESLVKPLQEQYLLFNKLETLEAPGRYVKKYMHTGIDEFVARIESFIRNPELAERVGPMLEKTLHALEREEGMGQPFLSPAEYESLGKKKAPNFPFNRKDIYRIFEWYRDKLETEQLWDEPDLVPQTVPGKYSYDVVVCDEVQDFTDSQLNLLFRFVKNPNNLFLAGDTKQTINPSGFRWEEVRRHFYERGLTVPELKTLSLNFRSSGSIVQLSNILLGLKEKFTGKKAEEGAEEWRYKGRPVSVISGIEPGDILEILKVSGADRTILVRTNEEKELLKKRLGTELVFTINEAKGLEFDTVLLWKFCAGPTTEDVWNVTLDLSTRQVHQAHIRHEINLLYVGITRSQRDLLIYDGPRPSVIWQGEPIGDHVYVTRDPGFIRQVWDVVTTTEEWERQGIYYFEREFYKAAAECFKNAGDAAGHKRALAYYSRQTGDFTQAALYFDQLEDYTDAAGAYEKAGRFRDAMTLWEKLNETQRAEALRAEVMKEEGDFAGAGQWYLENGKHQEAIECFQRAKRHRQVADIYHRHLGDEKKAAQNYELAKEFETAAKLYRELDMADKAAELYHRSKNYTEAETLWNQTGNTRQLIELYKETGNDEELLTLYEKEEIFDKAVKYLRKRKKEQAALAAEAAELFDRREYFKALIRYHVLEDGVKIAECYLKMEKYTEAAPYLNDNGDLPGAAEAYYNGGEYVKAFDIYVDLEEERESDYPRARQALEEIEDTTPLGSTGMKYYRQDDWERAAFIFNEAGVMPEYEGLCQVFMGNKEEAHEIWIKKAGSMYALHIIAHECVDRDMYEIAVEFYLTLPSYAPQLQNLHFEQNTIPWAVMENYFNSHMYRKDHHSLWGRFLVGTDKKHRSRGEIIRYLGMARDFCGLMIYFRNVKRDRPKEFKPLMHVHLKAAMSNEDKLEYGYAAFVYLWAGQYDEMERLLPKITMARYNFNLFLEGNADQKKRLETYKWCVDNDYKLDLREYLIVMEDREKLAEFYTYDMKENPDSYIESEDFSWESERAMLLLQKRNKYGAKCEYSFFTKDDVERSIQLVYDREKERIKEKEGSREPRESPEPNEPEKK
ncbi:MAG: UvrD-helicase domain-containing protein [bacterium]|nr:UvrD-helicase domain-containing protein [bacterium]